MTERGGRGLHLYVVPAGGGSLRRVSSAEVFTDRPAWSPDGAWIAYANFEGEIRRIHPDGTGSEVIAEFPGEEIWDLAWSPDGRRLAYNPRPESEEG